MKASARFVSTVNHFGLGRSEVGRVALPSDACDVNGTGARSNLFALAATLLASSVLLLGAASVANAATPIDSYGYLATFGAPAFPITEQFNAVAVDGSTGNIFLPRPYSPDFTENDVRIFSPDPVAGGLPLTTLNAQPEGLLPLTVAVDQADGSLYVADYSSRKIFRYLTDGAPVPTYTFDPSFSTPTLGFPNGLAVDPVTHDVLVGDRDASSHQVYRLDPTGALVSSFDGSNTAAGAFKGVAALAVGPTGTTYVVDDIGHRVEQFSSAGASLGTLISAANPTAIAVNPQSGEVAVLVGRQGQTFIDGFSAAGVPTFSARIPSQAPGEGVGLAWDSGTDRIYLAVAGGNIHTFIPAAQPGLDAPVISQVTPTGAHVEAKVAPGGEAGATTAARIEYCPSTAACGSYFVSNPGNPSNPWVRLPDHEGLNGGGEETIEDDLTGLDPFTNYLVRVSADRASADNVPTENTSASTTLETPPVPPKTETNDATDVSETGAVLNGTINPVGLPSTYHFEYGTTSAYGSRAPAGIEAVAGADRNNRKLGRTITGLEPGTTYHFRLVAQNSAGVNQGADRSFTTAGAGGIPHRAYEQVTPVDKKGIPIREGFALLAKTDGSAITYGAEGSSVSAPLISRFMSLRAAGDWTGGITLDPPLNRQKQGLVISETTLAVSSDFTHALVATNRKLSPDAIEDEPNRANLYIVDVVTGVYTLVGTNPEGLPGLAGFDAAARCFIAASPDFSWVVFRSPSLVPGAPDGALYRWSAADGLEVVSVVPHEGEMVSALIGNPGYAAVRSVSADGSRIYFVSGSTGLEAGEAGLFLREEGEQPKAISVSHIPGDPATPHQAVLVGTSKNGRFAFFFSVGGKLTSDAPDEIPDSEGDRGNMYRYDASDESLEYLGALARIGGAGAAYEGVSDPIAVGDDGHTAYWQGSDSTLAWHNGVVTTVSPGGGLRNFGASPDGRYLAFEEGKLVEGETVGDIYLYDSETDRRSCVSCLPDGSSGGGLGHLPPEVRSVNNRIPQAVTNSGQVFFTTPARLVAADVNGSKDIYEYHGGKNTLISPGNAPFDAILGDISEDGNDVFFTTAQKLVGQDNDHTPDIYDARINGGLAKQNPPPPQECIRDDCKATPSAGPELPFGGSEALSGPGNVSGAARKRCAKGTHARKVKGRTRCVKQSKTKNAKRANTNRRQGR